MPSKDHKRRSFIVQKKIKIKCASGIQIRSLQNIIIQNFGEKASCALRFVIMCHKMIFFPFKISIWMMKFGGFYGLKNEIL
jgi:hypothetical protein